MANGKNSGNDQCRYDLPSSRILIRSLRARDRAVEALAAESPPEERALLSERVLFMARDLFLARLLEDRGIVEDYWLSGGKRSQALEVGSVASRLSEFNEWAGFGFFAAKTWEKTGAGEALIELDHELHLSRFWPPGMPVEIIGALWEERLPVPKRTGVYYTPRRIVDLLLDRALAVLFEERRSHPIRFLDPACGSGYFLIEIYRRLIRRELFEHSTKGPLFAPLIKGSLGRSTLDPSRRMEILAESIHGVDLDGGALELSRRALFIETISELRAMTYPCPSPAPLFSNLKEGDSILERAFAQQPDLFEQDSPPPLKPFQFESETGFKTIMEEGGFDAVVGNPPWISLKGRHRQAPYAPEVVNHLVERYKGDTYRPNVVEFFIRRALELLAEGGVNAFVAPDRIAENEQYIPLRRYLLEKGEMLHLHFREPFTGVVADTLVYVFVKRQKPRRNYRITLTDAGGMNQEVTPNYFLRAESYLPEDAVPEPVEAIINKIEAAGKRKLAEFLETGVGFIARSNRISAEQTSEDQRPIIKGEHVAPYRREGCGWFEFTLSNLAGGTRSLDKLMREDRILLRKTGARLIAAIDRSRYLPEQSLYFAFPRDRRLSRAYDLRYFVGILNSRVMSFYFRHRKITNRATTPQIKKVHLDSLPIKPIQFNHPEMDSLHRELTALVEKREEAGEASAALALDDEIDRVTSLLYGLTPEELEIVRKEMPRGWP